MDNASMYEVLQLAIHLEEEGIKFYEKWAANAKGNVREVLRGLAKDELKHASYFKGLYYDLKEKPGVDYLFEEEVTNYFKNYAVSAAFNREQVNLDSVRDAVEEGILTEKKSIEYYQFLSKHAIDGGTKEMLGTIIEEEERHLLVLEKLLLEV